MSTILIADDEARIRRLVSDFLKRDGHTIVEAADGKEALNILENRRPGLDMAILDVMMPGMDGFEVLRELREQVVDYDKMKEENEWYAKILGLHEQHSDYTFASGKVIAVDPLSPFGNFTINAGTKSGIAVGDPVITAEGLVGLVSEVSFTSCKVRTILDVNTKASAMISRNGNTAITGGAPPLAEKGLLRLNTLEKSSGAAIGDIVVTSGRGGVFPEGLLIGKITEVNPESDGLSLYAIIEPYVDVRSLKNVMVITSFDGQGEGS